MDSQNGMFVTAIFAILDPEKGVLTYANAGHNLPLVLHKADNQLVTLEKGGIALGVIKNATYQENKIQILPGDLLLFYTDGVTDAFSTEGESFSEARLKSALQSAEGTSSNQVLEEIDQAIDAFRKGEPPSDDMTMVLIRKIMNGSL